MTAVRLYCRLLPLFLCMPLVIAQTDSLQIDPDISRYELGIYFRVLEDKQGSLSLADVEAMTDSFIQADKKNPVFGLSESVFWLRLRLTNSGDQPLRRILEFAYPLLDDLVLYKPKPTGGYAQVQMGDRFPFDQRDIKIHNLATDLELLPGIEQVYYLRVQTTGTVLIPAVLWSPNAFAEHVGKETLTHGMYFGLCLIMVLYNLFIFISVRDRSFLYCMVHIASFAVFQMILTGFAFQYLWPNAPLWGHQSLVVFGSLSSMFGLYFAQSFIRTKTLLPRFHHVLTIVAALHWPLIILVFIFSYKAVVPFVIHLGSVTHIVLITTGILGIIRGSRQAKFFLIAWFLLLAAVFIYNLRQLGLIESSFLVNYGSQIASALEIVLLALGLTDRINQMRKERSIAQRRALEAQEHAVESLRRTDKLKDDFLANTSHELRTPLNGIIGLAESLIDGVAGDLPRRAQKNLSLIVDSGRRLFHLVNDILDFSKLKNHSMNIKTAPLNLRGVVDVVLALNHPTASRKALTLVNDVPPNLPAVEADENRLQQILYNLVGNAIKFTENGSVKIAAKPMDRRICVQVIDTGIGIEKEQTEHIFESFVQADSSIERVYGGTGLGLAVTKHLVELHDGEVWVESKLGQGSTFAFTLPQSDQQPEPKEFGELTLGKLQQHPTLRDASGESAKDTTLPHPGAAFRVLVVDDDAVNRQVIKNHMAVGNYACFEAADGPEALAKLQEQSFDLVLLDIMMPHMSGFEVCREIRKQFHTHELPIIFLSAKNQVSDLKDGFSSGANDYLTKPISKTELMSRVETHLKLLDTHRNLEDRVSERIQDVRTLGEAGRLITAKLDLEEVLPIVYHYVKGLMSADHFMIGLYLEELGVIRFKLILEDGETRDEFDYDMTQSNRLAVWCVQQGKEVFVNEPKHRLLYKSDMELGPHTTTPSCIHLPLFLESQVVGVMTVKSRQTNAYTSHHLDMLRTLGAYTAIAADNARAYDALGRVNLELETAQQNIMSSLTCAERIQHAVLPSQERIRKYLPNHFVLFVPKELVSGDFYWVKKHQGYTYAAVADCVGHGVPGAFLSMIGHTLLNKIVLEQGAEDPADILTKLHHEFLALFEQGDGDWLESMELCLCRIKGTQVQFAGAHRHLLIARSSPNQGWWIERIKGVSLSIGARFMRQRSFESHHFELQSGTMLYLTSDGFTDQHSPAGKKFGPKRLRQLLQDIAGESTLDQQRRLATELQEHRRDEHKRDDITILGIRI